MKVSEVKKRIGRLKFDHDSMVRLRDLLDDTSAYDEVQKKMENDAGLICSLCDLYSDVADVLWEEIERLEKAVDDADVQV